MEKPRTETGRDLSWRLRARHRAGSQGQGLGHTGTAYLIEMGILCSCQPKALLMVLKRQQVGQQAGSDSNILTEVVFVVGSHLPQPLGQLFGLHSVQCSLVLL